MTSLGEISQLPKNIALNTTCTCGSPVQSCKFWHGVLQNLEVKTGIDLFADPYAFNLGVFNAPVIQDERHKTLAHKIKTKVLKALNYARLSYGIVPFPRALTNAVTNPDNNILLYDEVLSATGSQITVDSTKFYQKGIDLYRSAPDEVRVILLSRDGRGVLYSNLKRGLFSREKAVGDWVRYYTRAIDLLKKHVAEEHILRIRYENLAASPHEELAALCSSLGLPFEETMLDFMADEHHITNGNDMRFNQSSTIHIDDSWRNGLADDDLRYFENEAGELNRALGHLTA